LLLVTGSKEEAKFQGIEIMKADELEMNKLFPLGRLAVYTEQAIKELENLGEREIKEKTENKEKEK